MRAKSTQRGDGSEAGVCVSVTRRRDRFATSRSNGPRIRGWHARRDKSAISTSSESDPRLVLPGCRRARTATFNRYGIQKFFLFFALTHASVIFIFFFSHPLNAFRIINHRYIICYNHYATRKIEYGKNSLNSLTRLYGLRIFKRFDKRVQLRKEEAREQLKAQMHRRSRIPKNRKSHRKKNFSSPMAGKFLAPEFAFTCFGK